MPRLSALWLSLLLLLAGAPASGRVRDGLPVGRAAGTAALARSAERDAAPLLRAERGAVVAPPVVERTAGGAGHRPGHPPSTDTDAASSAGARVVGRIRVAALSTMHAVAARGGVLPYFPTAPPYLG